MPRVTHKTLPKPKLIYPMKCLRCDKKFLSWHRAKNRLCSFCQGGSVYICNGIGT